MSDNHMMRMQHKVEFHPHVHYLIILYKWRCHYRDKQQGNIGLLSKSTLEAEFRKHCKSTPMQNMCHDYLFLETWQK